MNATLTAPPIQNKVPLFALLGANTVSLLGSQLTLVAIPWFVLLTTGSATRTGIVAFCEIVPMIIASFFGGALVDRFGHRRTSILSDVISGLTVILIPLLHSTVGLAFWQLLILVFCGALFNVPGSTARSALLPDLTALAGMPIERATSAVQAIQRGSRLLGAPVAGLMVAAFGATTPLWLDGATFLISALLMAFVVAAPQRAVVPEGTVAAKASGNYLEEVREGVRFIRNDRLILTVVLTIMVTNLIEAVGWVGAPVYANRLYGSALALGLMTGAAGGGAMVSAILYGAYGHRLSRRSLFIGCFILVALGYWPLAFLPPLPVTIVALALLGLAAGPSNPILGAVQYEQVPAELRGRVIGAISAGANLAMPLGVLVGGVLLDHLSLSLVYGLVAGTFLLCTLTMLFNPIFHQMDKQAETPAHEPQAAGAQA
jgi:MFS family permease